MKIQITIAILILIGLVGAVYSGETSQIDLTGKFTIIDNCSSVIPLNYSINGLILSIVIPQDFEGNLTLLCSGWNDESTHEVTHSIEYYGTGGSIVYKNKTIYQNQTIEKIIYLNNESTPISNKPETNNYSYLWVIFGIIVLGIITVIIIVLTIKYKSMRG